MVHRFAQMLLALEEFELAYLCPEQRVERQQRIERYRRLVAEEDRRGGPRSSGIRRRDERGRG